MKSRGDNRSIKLRKFTRRTLTNLNTILSSVEVKNQQQFLENISELTPVFIVGLPRSGTTLLYQLLLNYFDWVYLSLSLEYLSHLPITAYKIQRLLFPQPKEFDYQSDYGMFKAQPWRFRPWSPTEGNQVWQRWFPERPTHYHSGDLSPTAVNEMRSMIAGLTAISGKPFLNKNPKHSVRLLSLSKVFPQALFIVLNRQSLYVAQSLYIARIRDRPKPDPNDDWWGARPREYMHLKDADPMTQAVGQTKAIERELVIQLQSCSSHFIKLDYQEVCQHPSQVLHHIQRVCLEHGIPLQRKRHDEPMPFPLKDERKGISESEFDRLQKLLDTDTQVLLNRLA
jgi:hypothetical protein